MRTWDGYTTSHPEEMLYSLSRPMSAARKPLRPLLVLAFVAALLWLLAAGGIVDPQGAWSMGPPEAVAGRLLIASLAAGVGVLEVLLTFIMVLIIASWISMVSPGSGVTMFAREWLDFLLSRFGRFRLQLGFIDLSPIIYFFAIELIYAILMFVLVAAFQVLGT